MILLRSGASSVDNEHTVYSMWRFQNFSSLRNEQSHDFFTGKSVFNRQTNEFSKNNLKVGVSYQARNYIT